MQPAASRLHKCAAISHFLQPAANWLPAAQLKVSQLPQLNHFPQLSLAAYSQLQIGNQILAANSWLHAAILQPAACASSQLPQPAAGCWLRSSASWNFPP